MTELRHAVLVVGAAVVALELALGVSPSGTGLSVLACLLLYWLAAASRGTHR